MFQQAINVALWKTVYSMCFMYDMTYVHCRVYASASHTRCNISCYFALVQTKFILFSLSAHEMCFYNGIEKNQ